MRPSRCAAPARSPTARRSRRFCCTTALFEGSLLSERILIMAWQDRPYYRDSSGSAFSPLMWLLNGSVPLFTLFGIRVRAHASLIILIAIELLFAQSKSGLGVQNAITSMSILFISVLLHEFGHCFGARWV